MTTYEFYKSVLIGIGFKLINDNTYIRNYGLCKELLYITPCKAIYKLQKDKYCKESQLQHSIINNLKIVDKIELISKFINETKYNFTEELRLSRTIKE